MAKLGEERRQRNHQPVLEKLGKKAGAEETILQHLAKAGGSLSRIAHHAPLSVAFANQVDRVKEQPSGRRHAQSLTGPQPLGIGVDQLGGHVALSQQVLRAVEILEHAVEQTGALAQSAVEPTPIFRGEQNRPGIEVFGAAKVLPRAQTASGEPATGFVPALVPAHLAQPAQTSPKLGPTLARMAVGANHLVELIVETRILQVAEASDA
jgi:hypothetical protein